MGGIYVPPEENLGLRNLVRRETKLTGNITRVKNRIKGYLNFMGLKFGSWSGSSLKIMLCLFASASLSEKQIRPVQFGRR